jgi:hypothetical protein
VNKARTILGTANPGDNIYFNRGNTFKGTTNFKILLLTRSGTQANPITIGAYGSGAVPIIEGAGPFSASPQFTIGIVCDRADWYIIQDLEITNTTAGTEFVGCRDIVLRRLSIHDLGAAGIVVQGRYSETTLLRASARFEIHDNTIYKTGLATNGEGIYIGTDPLHNKADDPTSDVTVYNNVIHDTAHEGIECKPDTIRCKVHHNRLYNIGHDGITLGWRPEDPVTDNDAWDNTIFDVKHDCIVAGSRGTNIDIYNNVLANCGAGGSAESCIQVHSAIVSGSVRHNTCYNANGSGIIIATSGVISRDNIVWGSGSGNDAADPLFINAASKNFNLQTGSPARGTASDGSNRGALQDPSFIPTPVNLRIVP